MAEAVPAGVPPEGMEAARGTLGSAMAVAERLPDPLGGQLLGPALEAFLRRGGVRRPEDFSAKSNEPTTEESTRRPRRNHELHLLEPVVHER